MRQIFISHSSKDTQQACMIQQWLQDEKYEPFLDSDQEFGLTAGSEWQKELKIRLDQCMVLIPVCSANFRTSDWCRYELDVACHNGKAIIPILIDDSPPIRILQKFQAIRLAGGHEDARIRLLKGLQEKIPYAQVIKLDPDRPPYRGLDPFLEADELLFRGRSREIAEGVEKVQKLRDEVDTALMMVVGASGSGKSSLVRAGLLPVFKRDAERWLVLDPFRPGLDPLRELANSLVEFARSCGAEHRLTAMQKRLSQCMHESLSMASIITELRHLTGRNSAILLITIDQFEELLATASSRDADERPQQVRDFLVFLKHVLEADIGKLLVIGTLRSDYLDTYQSDRYLANPKSLTFILRPMSEENFREVIEEPAEIAGIDIEKGLVDRIISDTKTGDALPLLSYTLRELWEATANDPRKRRRTISLTKNDYLEIGGLRGAIRKQAENIFTLHCPIEKEQALRNAFLRMVHRNVEPDQLGWVRRAAEWQEMPAESRDILDHFVKARLLVKKSGKTSEGKPTIQLELAHEALLRNWDRLRGWIKEDTRFLDWREDRFASDFELWKSTVPGRRDYLSGRKLAEAEVWKEKFSSGSLERQFIEASILRRKLRKVTGMLFVAALFGGLLYSLYLLQKAKDAEAEQLRIRHLSTIDTDPFNSGVAGLAAMGRYMLTPGISHQIARGLEQALERNLGHTGLISTKLSRIDAIVSLSDEELVVAGIQGRTAFLLGLNVNPNGTLTPRRALENSNLTTIKDIAAFGENPESLYTLGYRGNDIYLMRWSRDLKKESEEKVFSSLAVDYTTLTLLPGGMAIAYGYDEKLHLWYQGKVVSNIPEVSPVVDFRSLGQDQLISAHQNGDIKWWEIQQNTGEPRLKFLRSLSTDEGIVTLSPMAINDFVVVVAGFEDGSLRIVSMGDTLQVISKENTNQGKITALLALPNGEVISGDDQSRIRWWKWKQEKGQAGMLEALTIEPFNSDQTAITGLEPLLKNHQPSTSILSTGADGTLRILQYDFYPFFDLLEPPANDSAASVVALSEPSSGLIAAGHANGLICWWDTSAFSSQYTLRPSCKNSKHPELTALVLQGKDRLLVSSGSDGRLRWWNKNEHVVHESSEPLPTVESMISTADGNLITGHGDGSMRLWKDNQPTKMSQAVDGPVSRMISLSQQTFVAAGGTPGEEEIQWWKISLSSSTATERTKQDRIMSMVKYKSGEIITGGLEGSVQRWKNGRMIGEPIETDHQSAGVLSLVILNNGLLGVPVLVSAGGNGELNIWNRGLEPTEIGIRPKHETLSVGLDGITSLLETGDGALVSGGEDGSIKIVSPRKVVAAACREYERVTVQPDDLAEKEAAQLCRCQPPDQWWKVWRWICYWWNTAT